jgi:hypothetical protein
MSLQGAIRMAIGVGLVLSSALSAADKIQPLNLKLGLWQMTYTMDQNWAAQIPAELLAKMTPQQRARTQAKLKARAAQGPRTETKRFCLTEEKLNKAIFANEDNQSCQRTTIVASTAKLLQFHEECPAGEAKRTADRRFEALDPETMKGSMKADSTGTTLSMNADLAGKWIGADCSDVQ